MSNEGQIKFSGEPARLAFKLPNLSPVVDEILVSAISRQPFPVIGVRPPEDLVLDDDAEAG